MLYVFPPPLAKGSGDALACAHNGVVELLAIVDAMLSAEQAETHATGTGPSGTPNNVVDYILEQLNLQALKE